MTGDPELGPGSDPLSRTVDSLSEQLAIANRRVDELLHELADAPERGPATDPMMAIGIQTLSQAVEMLREDVDRERDRADRAERQIQAERQLVEEGRERIDELQASLAGLYADLVDARTAAMISSADAAALRTQLALLTGPRVPWWRRWFR